jgi:hypothetical protein
VISAVPETWVDAANAAGFTLDQIDIDPRDALIDAARRYEIPEADLDRFLVWAEDYTE